MDLFLILGIFLLPGIWLWFAGWRGRAVGSDVHCRGCGFNLRGRDPQSERCPECGVELTDRTMALGRMERMRGMMWTGAAMTAVSGIGIGIGGFSVLRDYDWAPWKPVKWLVEDVDTTIGADYTNAVRELKRRAGGPNTSASTVNAILDAAMAHQADRTKKWNVEWSNILAAAADANRLDAAHAQKYLQTAASATFAVRPKARRGQYLRMQFELKFDRLAENAQIRGSWTSSPLMIDATVFQKDFIGQREDHQMGYRSGYGTGYPLIGKALESVPNGEHQLRATIECVIRQTSPFAAGPVTIKLPVAAPVEIFAKDAIVDEFKTDPDVRDAERSAIEMTRVTHDSRGMVNVRLKVKDLPRSLAVQVVLAQGSQEQKVGGLVIAGGTPGEHWVAPYSWEKPRFTGVLDVHLRPDQSASDSEPALGSYWGEEIVIHHVQVDAPYDPPFNKDESLRAAVTKAIQPPTIQRSQGSKQLNVNISYVESPVKLAYKVIFSWNGHQVVVNPYGGYTPPKQNTGYGTVCNDVDPAHQATECDVIFRPDPEWETSSPDLTPPWAGEIILHHVKISAPPTPPAH